jgi:hypothetical protein
MDYAKEYDRMVEQSNQQQERIKELEADTRITFATLDSKKTLLAACEEQLAASQAREQVLLEALKVSHTDSNYDNQQKFLKALSTPSDDTALREYGAKLLEEMAVELGVCEHKCDVEVRNKAAELRSGD